MTAADKREELEAAIHAQLTRAWKYGLEFSPGNSRTRPADAILAAADAYASAVADERIAGRVHDRTIGRERLAELNAAVSGGS